MSTLTISPLSDWLPNATKPIIISGPCGAESEEQILTTAREIAKLNRVTVFRAGIWKPRTRPNSFEGVGSIGLQWLKKVKQETGLLTTVEVANAQHVEEALKNNVDILWIGARTTVNPFSVQEIADALAGVDIPVMVKNPIHPDLQLWIGAIERINNAGITKIAAIHRGFHSSQKTQYRNAPMWEIPIELKSQFPQLPIFCDISHISGKKDLLFDTAQIALDLDVNGLMIESHINPKEALSDAKQQITPSELGKLLCDLTVRKASSKNKEFTTQLEKLRKVIDEIDEELMQVLARRMEVIEKIGEYKRENDVTILQIDRLIEILETRVNSGSFKGLDKSFVKNICLLLHQESIRKQNELMNAKVDK